MAGQLVHVDERPYTDAQAQSVPEKRTDYVSLGGKSIARVENKSTVTYIFADHLGSPVATKKGSAAIKRERYTPFGIAMDDNPDLTNQGGFTGHIKDAATDLNYMQARYYDPVMGRFLSIDPITFLDKPYPGQFNRYAYTWNDPINATDPNDEFLKIVKSVYNVGKRTYKNGGNLKGALKDEALSYVENGATLLSKDASLGDKAFAIFDLATGFGDEAKGAKRLLGGKCCFVAGTLVETEDGLRPIEEIELDDRVLARNPETGKTAFKAVTDLIRLNERMIWEVSLSGENNSSEFFETTDDHPWWIVDADGNGSWKKTAELSDDMIVTTADNQTMVITKVVKTDRVDATYNLTVADFETYFVGENKVLVHNCKKNRSTRPDPLEEAEGRPHSIIEKPGPDGQYTTHNGDGTFKQYRGSGKDHGDVPRLNVKENKLNEAPNGQKFPGKTEVRPPFPDEIPR
ncbi:RHS repeat-associated core domain-containing protein [Litorimonas taeanensis]|nr:RHS repeat-associated core domain-containing protein [Litorimonas taeanensis]